MEKQYFAKLKLQPGNKEKHKNDFKMLLKKLGHIYILARCPEDIKKC